MSRLLSALPLSPKQIQSIVEAENHRIACWEGAVRSGKTVSTLFGFLAAITTAPNSGLVVIAGRTLQTIERNIIAPLQDEGLMGDLAKATTHTRGASTATVLGRTVHLVGAADVRAEEKLRGLTACLALVDEATILPEGFWNQLLARLSIPGARLLATTNPGSRNHWLKTKFLDRAGTPGLDLVSWHFTLDDNPGLDEAYKAAIKAEHTGLFYQRNVLGLWVAAEGAIYDSWDPDRHVIAHDDLPPMIEVFAMGLDHGITNDTVGILIGLGQDRRLYAVDEWAIRSRDDRASMPVAAQAASLARWLETRPRPRFLFVDPAAAAFRVQLTHDRIGNVAAAENDVAYGIALVSSLLGADRLRVSTRCENLIREMPEYRWDEKASEKGEDKPVKENDHACDALRYGVATSERLWRPALDLFTDQQPAAA